MSQKLFLPDPVKFEAFIWLHLSQYLEFPIEDFHRELIGFITENRVALAAPRFFAKSTYFSFFYPLYQILENPGVQVLLVSATGALAESWLAKIRNELETNPSLRRFYGAQNEKGKWATDELHLANGSVILAKGAEKQIRGFHPNVVIGDDLETDEIVASQERCKKFDDWFWRPFMGMMGGLGQVILIGTVLHPESFLAQLINKGRHGWTTHLYTARDAAKTKALWPDKFPLELLHSIELETGVYSFEQEYMNNPIPDDLRKFQKKWIQYYDKIPEGCVYFTTIDPAIEIENANDFTAIVTCAVDSDSNIYVAEVINKRLLPKETIDYIFDVYKRWGSSVIGIEDVGFQKMLKIEVESERRRRNLYPIITELKSGGRRKGLRIEALQPRFESGRIFIRKNQEELETQLLRFPSTRCHDDIIDALAYQLDILRPAHQTPESVNPNSFAAHMDRLRRKSSAPQVWGNHRLARS